MAVNAIAHADPQHFRALLKELLTDEDARLPLWIEIYENAVADREAANALFSELNKHMQDNSEHLEANHSLHGQTLAKYLERAHRSNEQLIKLSEMITDVISDNSDEIGDVFAAIGNKEPDNK